jgi:hypothetical protein
LVRRVGMVRHERQVRLVGMVRHERQVRLVRGFCVVRHIGLQWLVGNFRMVRPEWLERVGIQRPIGLVWCLGMVWELRF